MITLRAIGETSDPTAPLRMSSSSVVPAAVPSVIHGSAPHGTAFRKKTRRFPTQPYGPRSPALVSPDKRVIGAPPPTDTLKLVNPWKKSAPLQTDNGVASSTPFVTSTIDEPFVFNGQTVQVPLPEGQGTGLAKPLKLINHPVRENIPIWWASLMGKSVTATAQYADGWLPIFFDPEKFHDVWGDELKAGVAKRDPSLGKLQISAGGMVAIGDQFVGETRDKILDYSRPHVALYVGGMGARDKNFYNTIAQKYGYVKEAIEIQDLYLAGKKAEAAAVVPGQMLENTNLIGPKGYVKERLAAYKEAGVTMLSVNPVGGDDVATVETLRELIGD